MDATEEKCWCCKTVCLTAIQRASYNETWLVVEHFDPSLEADSHRSYANLKVLTDCKACDFFKITTFNLGPNKRILNLPQSSIRVVNLMHNGYSYSSQKF